MKKIITGCSQLLTMRNLPNKGAIRDEDLEVINNNAAIVVEDGEIKAIGTLEEVRSNPAYKAYQLERVAPKTVIIPGFVDCHTHICFAGSRKMDYVMRLQGKSYLEIAANGGGINSSVAATRASNQKVLADLTLSRINRHLRDGVTTIEIKSGYGLTVEEELKMLRAINEAAKNSVATIVPTCLAAHIKPREFEGNNSEYLQKMAEKLLPQVKAEGLAKRIDIFVEESAFNVKEAKQYLKEARDLGFEITIHADQFSAGASELAVEMQALSADHLEVSGEKQIKALAKSDVVAVMLPGASFGLGMLNLAPARALLDAGAAVAIASDWNPGSAPMGDLLVQSAIFGSCQKLSIAETLSALTFRAALALNQKNVGKLQAGYMADLQVYPFDDYRDIFYNQGKIKPIAVYKKGQRI